MSELAKIRIIPREGSLPPFDILTIRLPSTYHVTVENHGLGEIAVHIFEPTSELLAELHAATAIACDGKCPCFVAGEEAEKEHP